MAVRVHVPLSDQLVEDKKGNVYRIVKVRFDEPGHDKIEVGEIPDSASIIDGPTGYDKDNFYLTVPAATSGTDNKRVSISNMHNPPAGEYKILVQFKGQNPGGH